MFNPFKINTTPFETALMEAQASKYLIMNSGTGLVYGYKTKGPYTSVRDETIKYLLGTKQIEFSHETSTAVYYTIVPNASLERQ